MLQKGLQNTFIIAEAGVNHNGDIDTALDMIDAAKTAGADAVKFQTFRAESLVSKDAPKAAYQKRTSMAGETQLDMLKRVELDMPAHKILLDHCRNRDIMFLSSPFDLESIDLLNTLGLKIFKIPSGEITNLPYLRKIGSLDKTLIVSTGMADMDEIKTALDILERSGTHREDITILHCNTEYPTPMEDVNLRAMLAIKETLGVKVGYSDHTLGIEIAIAAAALGADVIEKHFTLDKNMPGPDHKASIEPDELALMVKAIRNIEKAMGDGIKRPSPSEAKNLGIIRKSIVAARHISKGEVFTESNITAKRSSAGTSPVRWEAVIRRQAKRNFQPDEVIEI